MTLVYTGDIAPGRPGKEVSSVGLELYGGFTGDVEVDYGSAVIISSGKIINPSISTDIVAGVLYASTVDPLGVRAERACDYAVKGLLWVRIEKEVQKNDPVYVRFKSYQGKKRGTFTNNSEVVVIGGVEVEHAFRLVGKVYQSDTYSYADGIIAQVRF